MQDQKSHIRHCILYEFQLGHSAGEAVRNVCQALGQGSVTKRTCQLWFQRFRSGDFRLEDRPRSGRPSEVDSEAVRKLVEEDPRLSSRSIASTLGYSHTSVLNCLHTLRKVPKLGSWIPHSLTQHDKDMRLEVCTFLLSKKRRFDWLDHLITGDEKWVLYVNHTRKRQWVDAGEQAEPEPKADPHQKKVMLSVWWDVDGIAHFELLPPNTSITADYYCRQLESLRQKVAQTRPQHQKISFLHDNARPHTAKSTRLKLLEMGWEILPHPPYSPDIAPSDYHLFRALQLHLSERGFDDADQLEADIRNFFAAQPASFYRDASVPCLTDGELL